MGQAAHLAFSTWSLNYSSLTSTSFHADLKFSFTPIPFLTWVPWRCCIFIFWFFRLFYILFLLPCPTSFPSKYFIWLIMFVFQNFYFWQTKWWRKTTAPPNTHRHRGRKRELFRFTVHSLISFNSWEQHTAEARSLEFNPSLPCERGH